MADIKRCDRCGVIYEQSLANAVVSMGVLNKTALAEGGDICPDCQESYRKWWKREQDGPTNELPPPPPPPPPPGWRPSEEFKGRPPLRRNPGTEIKG